MSKFDYNLHRGVTSTVQLLLEINNKCFKMLNQTAYNNDLFKQSRNITETLLSKVEAWHRQELPLSLLTIGTYRWFNSQVYSKTYPDELQVPIYLFN
jgi:hypothetical protein